MSERRAVAIVGGGPAGLAAAIALRARDVEVVVLEARRPPLEKACGEGLMPEAVAALERLGVDLAGAGRPFRGILYRDQRSVVEGRFGVGCGLGLERLELHRRLRERAEAAGAELRWGSRVESIAREGGGWTLALRGGDALRDDGALSVELLIGADGLHSRVRRWLGQASSAAPAVRRCGVRRHLTLAPWSDLVEVHWTDGAEAYVTPIADQAIGIAVLWSEARREGKGADPRATFDVLIDRFPWLSERLAGAAPLGADRGAAGLRQPVGGVVAGERAALVGDASGYLDAITGEGMAIAFAQAELLAAAYRAGELARYATAQRRLRRRPETITRLVLLLAAHPGLRRRALTTLSRRPELFRRLLAVHAGEAPAFQPGLWARLAGGVALGR